MGFRQMNADSLRPKHMDALVERWKSESIGTGTIKNRMSAMRWWAEKIGKENVVARDITLFALATGLRQANVTGLRWAQVDLLRQTAWIPAEEAKGDEDIHISLSELAIKVLSRQVGMHGEKVFTYAGKPVRHVNTKAWRSALQRAGISNFRWHDLRHTWASWLVQNGTPLYDLQEMGGWKSAEMVRRYAHLAPAQMAKHAAVVGALLHDTNAAHEEIQRTFEASKNRTLEGEAERLE